MEEEFPGICLLPHITVSPTWTAFFCFTRNFVFLWQIAYDGKSNKNRWKLNSDSWLLVISIKFQAFGFIFFFSSKIVGFGRLLSAGSPPCTLRKRRSIPRNYSGTELKLFINRRCSSGISDGWLTQQITSLEETDTKISELAAINPFLLRRSLARGEYRMQEPPTTLFFD